MKTRILILLLFPMLCFAQSSQQTPAEKPPTDACPTWDKKSTKTSKAEYFQFLKSNKAKDKREAIYTATPTGNSYSITRTTNVEPRTARGRRARANTIAAQTKEEQIETATPSNETIIAKEEIEEKAKAEIKQEPILAKDEIVIKDKTDEAKAPLEVNKTEAKKIENEKDSPIVNSEKIKQDTKVAGRKVKRFFTRKNKGGKGKAAKCPDF